MPDGRRAHAEADGEAALKRDRKKRDGDTQAELDTSTRTLPHNLEAEKALLGGVLVNEQTLERAQGVVKAGDFFRRGHRMLFEVCVALHEKKVALDIVTIVDECRRVGALEEVGGPSYITALTDGVPRSTNVGHYAAIVAEQAALRRAIVVANEMLSAAYSGEVTAVELVTQADKAIIGLQRGGEASRITDLRTANATLYAEIERRAQHPGQLTGVDTGFPSVNEVTLGWQAADMIVLGARPSIGKTAFVLNTAVAGARTGVFVGLFSLEMRTLQLQMRLASYLSTVNGLRLMQGHLGEYDYPKIADSMGTLGTLPIFVDDRGRQSLFDIRATCRRMRAEHGLGLVIVDYIQLMPGTLDRRGATRTEELSDISRRLKELADELGCPVIVLSQLNRAGDNRPDKRPILSDLRECGALEQDADIVAFLHRKNHRQGGPTAFIIEKQRNGPTGTFILDFARETQTFTDNGAEPEQVDIPDAAEQTDAPKRPPPGYRGRRR